MNDDRNKYQLNKGKPILKAHIEEAQRNTNSNASAAKWLGVSYHTYKKYATFYGLFDSHLNQSGVGVDKGFSKNPRNTPLRDILAGKHPNYSMAKLKNRLIARKKLVEQCSCCGFNERRITDGRVPLILTFKDSDTTNFNLANLELLCYNCSFLTSGAPSVVNKRNIVKSIKEPHKVPKIQQVPPTVADNYDIQDDQELWDTILTDEEREAILESLEGNNTIS